MSKVPRIIAIVLMVGGVVMIVAGIVTYYTVHRELADEKIVVSDDAENFAGDKVEGPFTAYAEATVIKKHATEIADGLTYAELDREDPRRDSVMTSSFLRASLFTSVVAFGVAVLVIGLGVLFILVGVAVLAIDRRTSLALAGAGPTAVTDPGTGDTAAVVVPVTEPAPVAADDQGEPGADAEVTTAPDEAETAGDDGPAEGQAGHEPTVADPTKGAVTTDDL
jgi:hypothetical protein